MSQRAWIVTGVAVAVVAAAAFLLTRPSDEDRIRDTVTAYYDALADGDYSTVCDKFADARIAIITAGGSRTCPQEIQARMQDTGDLGDLHGVAITRVRVDGPIAYATTSNGHTLELEDDNGWRILDPGE